MHRSFFAAQSLRRAAHQCGIVHGDISPGDGHVLRAVRTRFDLRDVSPQHKRMREGDTRRLLTGGSPVGRQEMELFLRRRRRRRGWMRAAA